jgi:hypothetical protein
MENFKIKILKNISLLLLIFNTQWMMAQAVNFVGHDRGIS